MAGKENSLIGNFHPEIAAKEFTALGCELFMKNILFSFFAVLTLFVYSADACTLQGETISKFDETEYIFIGKVVGYAKSLTLPVRRGRPARGQAGGLIVEIKEKVFLPKTPAKHFEVFPFGLGADCSALGVSRAELLKEFPLDSEVRVIAYQAAVFPSLLPGGNIRLEVPRTELGSLALNTDSDGNKMSSVESVFDYKAFTYNGDTDSESKALLPAFEIRKDLLRLRNSRNQKERTDILNRLKDMPDCCSDLDFEAVFKQYSSVEPNRANDN